ncbi:MAG TPA: TssQ family T6SS-associated lipoprotein [Burkholderiales bacterium]|nr:TssQ family T6SS-associated lipoprotein [Burkholderiales bacterium]
MLKPRPWLYATAAVLLCAGCVGPLKDMNPMTLIQGKGAPALSEGIKSYDDGEYDKAQKSLNGALEQGLSLKSDQVKAHKYLAFTYCVNKREHQCREEFKKALEINPDFELEPTEAGHPLWGPVFRSVKTRK